MKNTFFFKKKNKKKELTFQNNIFFLKKKEKKKGVNVIHINKKIKKKCRTQITNGDLKKKGVNVSKLHFKKGS